jgi:hypothetical protein
MHYKYKDAYSLSEKLYIKEAEPLLRKVFLNDDPFGIVLHPNITRRAILYPIWGDPDKELLEAIFNSAKKVGDTGCYLTNLNRYPDVENEINHCYIPLSSFETFVNSQSLVNIILESIIYSASGSWGLMISHEHHGVLGGDSEFMESMRQFLPDLDTQIHSWLLYFKEEKEYKSFNNLSGLTKEEKEYRSFNNLTGLTLDWLPTLLIHIYGDKYASTLLKQYSLP